MARSRKTAGRFFASEVSRKLLVQLAFGAAGFLVSRGAVFGQYAPFGVALAAAAPFSNLGAALAGTLLGYLIPSSVHGVVRYIAALIACAAIRWTLNDLKRIRSHALFAPLVALCPLLLTGLAMGTVDGFSSDFIVMNLTEALLAAGAAYTLRLRGSVALAASGWIVNTASVSSDTPDPDPSNNLDTIVTPVSALADLAVEKSASPSPVEAGGTVTYRLQITNGGPADAQNVRIGDRLPEGVEQGAYSLDEGATWMPWDGAYALGSIAAGAGTVILIRGTVTAAPGDTLENTAIVGSDTPDPDPDNNTSTVQTPVTGGSSADLALAKSAAPTPAIPGQRLVYTLVVTNYGPDSVNDATLYDALPPGLDDAEYSVDGGAAWQPWSSPYILGSLAAGQSTAVLIRALVGASAAGILHNTATILSSLPDPNEANNTAAADTPVQSGADLSISKTACPDPAVPCQYLTYRLTVTNGGPADAADVLITDVIPPQLRCPVYSLDGGCSWYSWTGSFALGALGAGCSVTVLIAGIVDPCVPGEIANQASVSSLTFDPDLTNNTAAITVSRC